MNKNKPKILVVCGRNKRRSRTAEYLFKNDNRFEIRSAGLSVKSEVKISEKFVKWADLILVMEDAQRKRIQDEYRTISLPKIENLEIEDEYEYRDSELVELLISKMNTVLEIVFKI